MKKENKEKLKNIGLVLGILAVVAPFYLTVGCPIRFLTGVSCLGCGMSRAAEALLHLDFIGAFHYHPLIYMMPICLVVFLLRRKIPPIWMKVLFALGVIIMIVVYFIRLFSGSEIVYFRPETGFIHKVMVAIKEFIKYAIQNIAAG